jgi:hypothetical protein
MTKTSQYWREQAGVWRSMAEYGDDVRLHAQLLLLVEEAEAIAAEIDAENGEAPLLLAEAAEAAAANITAETDETPAAAQTMIA